MWCLRSRRLAGRPYVWGWLFFGRVRIMPGSRRVPSGTRRSRRDAGAGLSLGLRRRRRRAACWGRRDRLSQQPAADQRAADDRSAGEDPGGPPERGGVAVHQRLPGQGLAADQPGRGEIRREVGGDGGSEDTVQQRGAERSPGLPGCLPTGRAARLAAARRTAGSSKRYGAAFGKAVSLRSEGPVAAAAAI